MTSEEAVVGRRVRVSAGYRKPELRGRTGTILTEWGDPHSVAVDVLLDDGTMKLFWHHELDGHEGDGGQYA